MKINRDNYEAYFLDYHERQLSPDMVKEVLMFVELNPDLKNIFEEFEAVTLVADQDIVFENKVFIKKNQDFTSTQINELNCEEFLISETEGLLDHSQIRSLDEFIRHNPHFENDRRLFALTRLQADNDVVFEAKESLKQIAIAVGLIDASTYETYMARELEGDLSKEEKLLLAEFMQFNPHLQKERSIYKHTILSADTEIIFENKQQLKRSVTPVRRIGLYVLSLAASLAIIMSVYFLLDRTEIPGRFAENEKVKNISDQQINTPAEIIPENQVAVNTKLDEDIVLTPIVGKGNMSDPSAQTSNNELSNKADARAVNRHPVVPLQSRTSCRVTTRQFVDPQFTFIRTSQMYSNELYEFYYNLKLAEEIKYAQLNSKDKNPAKTILNAASGKAEDLFAANRNTQSKKGRKNFSVWTFAELGVQTFNTITSSELELKLRKDDEGNVVAYGVQSGILDFEKEVKK